MIEVNNDVDLLKFLLDYSSEFNAKIIHKKVLNQSVAHNLIMRTCDSLEYLSTKVYHKLDSVLSRLQDDGWLVALDDRKLNGLLILSRIVWGDDEFRGMVNNIDDEQKLSKREIEVLQTLAKGLSNQEIATELFISVNTVRVHLRNIYQKLQVQSRTEATMCGIKNGWITSSISKR